jgi:protein translocase SecG subunit
MIEILPYVQIALAAILVVLILLQERSAGMSGLFGGDTGGVYQTRRGLERIIFGATIVGAILFAGIAVAQILLG